MIYPKNFEAKIGFSEIRSMLKENCLSTLGKGQVDTMTFTTHAPDINESLEQTREFRRIEEEQVEFPLGFFFDCRQSLLRIRIVNTHLDEDELFNLRRSLDTINSIVDLLNTPDDETHYPYPALHRLAEDIPTKPQLVQRIDQILDKFGHIRDTASPQLADIRRELARAEGSVSRTLNSILRSAQAEGVVDKDVAPTMRDGRLVIPVAPGLKRKIRGIVHDESATGKTVFVEPAEVVEANNRIRELEAAERQEVIRILTEFTKVVRPHVSDLLLGYRFLAEIDFVRAKARLAGAMKAFEPVVEGSPAVDWIQARHPLLEKRIAESHPVAAGEDEAADEPSEKIVPLDIILTPEKHMLIISGPNAGGKSVCLKTVGLLQYMVQCGLSIPVGGRSKVGVFDDIMIDIGDEQSLENDLSTYSSHLLNMKNMMRQAGPRTLILIDEFGTGTEPQIGGAIAESVLERFCAVGAWGVITTHYQNLKHFADSHDGVVNGAMLYDRHEMRPLFQLAIGRPGSSFAIEIARKIGLPEEVISRASDLVGSDYIQSDKYLQDIVRDKRYWEHKRQSIRQKEKELEETLANYQSGLEAVERQRKEILAKAKREAEELLAESNKKIENAIREIKESQAEREETRRIRQELKEFGQDVEGVDTKAADDDIARKIARIKARKERHAKRQAEKAQNQERAAKALREAGGGAAKGGAALAVGDAVRIRGTQTAGRLETVDGKMATAVFGEMRTKVPLSRLEPAPDTAAGSDCEATAMTKSEERAERLQAVSLSRETRQTMDEHRHNFHQDLDIRGMRGDEALNAVQYFIDDAILVGMPRVRILHGKGNGILRQLVRQYLSTVPNVTHFADEHVQFGGAGITVVDLE